MSGLANRLPLLPKAEVEAAAVSSTELPRGFHESAVYWAGEFAGHSMARYYARKARPIYRHGSPHAGTPHEHVWDAGFDAGVERFGAAEVIEKGEHP